MGVRPLRQPLTVSAALGLWLLLAVTGMLWLGFYGWATDNVAAIAVSTIFGFMLAVTFIFVLFVTFVRQDMIRFEGSIVRSSQAWVIGFVPWFFIGMVGRQGSTLSLLTLEESRLMSALSGQLPGGWEFFLNRVANPVNEWLFWGIGLPLFIVYLMHAFGRVPGLGFLRNRFLQFGVVLVALMGSFVVFHAGKLGIAAFVIAAAVFRAMQTTYLWGELVFDFPVVAAVASFVLGSHHGMNFGDAGVGPAASFLLTHPAGWLTLFVFGVTVLVAVLDWMDTVVKVLRMLPLPGVPG